MHKNGLTQKEVWQKKSPFKEWMTNRSSRRGGG
jgi:hypothetical protein